MHSRVASLLLSLILCACAGKPAERAPAPAIRASVSVVDVALVSSAAPIDAGQTIANDPPDASEPAEPEAPKLPASAFSWICGGGQSGQDVVIAVKDDNTTFTLGMGDVKEGPFNVVQNDGSNMMTFKRVVEGKDLKDPDLQDGIKSVHVKAADVVKLTIYGVAVRGGWSFGMWIAANRAGKIIGKSSWSMRPANARGC